MLMQRIAPFQQAVTKLLVEQPATALELGDSHFTFQWCQFKRTDLMEWTEQWNTSKHFSTIPRTP